ncbi:hypothetical protein AGMMS50229_15890 [Campylobacterota bacterium]|nr:hypothetical protein AGMMS50229_15890 [Campylobacterota bacterium]
MSAEPIATERERESKEPNDNSLGFAKPASIKPSCFAGFIKFAICYAKTRYIFAIIYAVIGYALTKKISDRAAKYFYTLYGNLINRVFAQKYHKIDSYNNGYFDICGAKLPEINSDDLVMLSRGVFYDTFLVLCRFNDNYSKTNIEWIERYIGGEGAYGYKDGNFDVTVKAGDTVIDAGAWIGDFAAYAASKGAKSYAFEPTSASYAILQKTAALNDNKIIPIQKGLGDRECELLISLNEQNSGANSILNVQNANTETISITSLDRFVEENHIDRIDFIKADIEGAERDMLKGARSVLATHAPKLAICTYHLPDDPQVLEEIILSANPNYRVIHLRKKLFACVADRR